MTDEEYKKYFLGNEYQDILGTADCFFSAEFFWQDVLDTLDEILEKEAIMRL